MKLGQLLLHRRIIDRTQLHAALRRQAECGRPVGEVLLEMGVVSRKDIVAALRRQPHGSVDSESLTRVDPEVRDLLDAEHCREWRAIPVTRCGDTLVVAMADPTDSGTVDKIASQTDLSVIAIAVDASALAAVLDRPPERAA